MIRNFFDWLEDWALNDDNVFIGIGKLSAVFAIVSIIVVGPFVYLDSKAPAFTLRKDEWVCTASHKEVNWVFTGHVHMPVEQSVCDNYRRIR